MDVLTYYTGDTGPPIRRGLALEEGGDQSVNTGLTYFLRVRPMWSDQLVINSVMSVDALSNELVYQPHTGDFANQGVAINGGCVLRIGIADEYLAAFCHTNFQVVSSNIVVEQSHILRRRPAQ